MNIFIEDTQTGLYLAYDPATDVIIWVVGTATAHRYSSQEDANITLALLNTELEPNRFVGRPGDRGGH